MLFYTNRFLAHKTKKYAKYLVVLGFGFLFFAIYANLSVDRFSEDVFDNLADTPEFKVGLLLGTSKYLKANDNPYYAHRIEAAAQLYKSGKIKKIIASGDGSTFGKCEPEQMRADLVAKGVLLEDIVLDYAGFRTLDSVLRCKKIFGVSEFLVISQDFHCRRALFIASRHGISAKGFAAEDAAHESMRRRRQSREFFARSAAMADVDIINRPAKIYGDPVVIFGD